MNQLGHFAVTAAQNGKKDEDENPQQESIAKESSRYVAEQQSITEFLAMIRENQATNSG